MTIGRTTPGRKLVAITPSDVTVFNPTYRGLWVGGAGDVAVVAREDSAAVTLVGVPAGTLLAIEVKQVMATNTTATSIVGIY